MDRPKLKTGSGSFKDLNSFIVDIQKYATQLEAENELANQEIDRLRQVVKHQGIQLVVNKNK